MIQNKLSWQFGPANGSPDGIHNSSIEYFTGDYNYHLAREVLQNSRDAARNENGIPLKVNVSFNLEYIDRNKIPGLDELVEAYISAKEYWESDTDTQKFVNNALTILKKPTIAVLTIKDSNTTGLSGSDEDIASSWFSLARAKGASPKGHGQGGSFGIGKGAPFAASDLRVVLYSTKHYKDNKHIFQGTAELVSFKKDDTIQRGRGFYAEEKYRSARNCEQFTDFMRSEPGLSIYILGYKDIDGWEKDLVKSVLRNFWYAVLKDEIRVTIQGKTIDSNTIEGLLVENFADEPLKDNIEPKGNPFQYYLAVKDATSPPFEKELPVLGKVKFYFRNTPDPLNYVAMLRKQHMVIYSRAFYFAGPYSGVFVCDDEKGNEILRKMEPPEHDKWDPARNSDNGNKAYNEITEFVRECLRSLSNIRKGVLEDIPELSKYMPDEGDEPGNGKGESYSIEEESEEESAKERQQKLNLSPEVLISPHSVKVINESSFGHSLSGQKPLKERKSKKRKQKMKDNKEVDPEDLNARMFLIDSSKLLYRIILEPAKDININLKIEAAGDTETQSGEDKIELKGAGLKNGSFLHFKGSRIYNIPLVNGVTTEINVELLNNYKLATKLRIYEYTR
jgi:hypothetical protein